MVPRGLRRAVRPLRPLMRLERRRPRGALGAPVPLGTPVEQASSEQRRAVEASCLACLVARRGVAASAAAPSACARTVGTVHPALRRGRRCCRHSAGCGGRRGRQGRGGAAGRGGLRGAADRATPRGAARPRGASNRCVRQRRRQRPRRWPPLRHRHRRTTSPPDDPPPPAACKAVQRLAVSVLDSLGTTTEASLQLGLCTILGALLDGGGGDAVRRDSPTRASLCECSARCAQPGVQGAAAELLCGLLTTARRAHSWSPRTRSRRCWRSSRSPRGRRRPSTPPPLASLRARPPRPSFPAEARRPHRRARAGGRGPGWAEGGGVAAVEAGARGANLALSSLTAIASCGRRELGGVRRGPRRQRPAVGGGAARRHPRGRWRCGGRRWRRNAAPRPAGPRQRDHDEQPRHGRRHAVAL